MSYWEREKSDLNDLDPRKKIVGPVSTGQTGRAKLTKRLLTYNLLFRLETNNLN